MVIEPPFFILLAGFLGGLIVGTHDSNINCKLIVGVVQLAVCPKATLKTAALIAGGSELPLRSRRHFAAFRLDFGFGVSSIWKRVIEYK